MNFSKIYSAQSSILTAHGVDIEVDISRGLHSFTIVGLPDKAIDESRDRVSASIKNSGLTSPKQKNHKVVISLAPANIKKTGPNFDLPIALAYLQAVKEIKFDPEKRLFVGELSLDGKLRKTLGILPIVIFARKNNFKEIFLPIENITEASLIKGIDIYGAKNLNEVINHLNGKEKIPIIKKDYIKKNIKEIAEFELDFSDIKGQENAKRALLIAASGGHNVAFYGPPGTGKTMLAKSFKKILPPLSYKQIIECTSIHSLYENKINNLIINPPFRSPHHTASYTSIIGGGKNLKPGEITLAHNGVLFLDELLEFDRRTIESLRQPIEEGKISISRVNERQTFPTNFILIVSMNPCPCGYYKTGVKICKCQPASIEKYQKKISGPIVDRIDIWVEINNIKNSDLLKNPTSQIASESIIMKNIVKNCREIQEKRFQKEKLNKDITPKEIRKYCNLNLQERKILDEASENLNLSARSYHRILKISRTIADLDHSEKIKTPHLLEALRYRPKY